MIYNPIRLFSRIHPKEVVFSDTPSNGCIPEYSFPGLYRERPQHAALRLNNTLPQSGVDADA